MRAFKKCIILLLSVLCLMGCTNPTNPTNSNNSTVSLDSIPEFTNEPYVVINNNVPLFKDSDKTTKSFEKYSNLDKWGRCGVAYANLSQELMPTEERGNISMVKPSGWHTVKYDNVDGKYLYNRCHLIGFQLAGENANEKNLITGTRYMNVEGMLPFENMVADYIKETNNHVLYRVTPIYKGDNLIANGVTMEAYSVEDNGRGVQFYVYVYNNHPGIKIDYLTGDSYSLNQNEKPSTVLDTFVIGNKNTKVYHHPECNYLPAKKNQIQFKSSQEAEKSGYHAHNCIKQ